MSEASYQLPAAAPARSKRAWWRALAGLLLLVATIAKVDVASLIARLSQLQASYLLLGAALTVPQLHWLALRWRLTARALGLPLSRQEALREYSLSFLLNQLLPFGVIGDGLRIVRQGRKRAAWAGALHSVLLERALGHMVLLVCVLAVLPLWFGVPGAGIALSLTGLTWLAIALARAFSPAAPEGASAWRQQLAQLMAALARLLASRRTLGPVLGLSVLILLSIGVQLYCALWSLDLSLSPLAAAKVFPLLLLSMSVPLAFAGFGPREAAAASLFDAMQLSRLDGLAFSVAFGSLLLCSSVPSLGMALWFSRDKRR
jgi:uncharacterized membrane protein YbhN (UPF0104 family)